MSVDLLVNLALADLSPAPVVLPYERVALVPRERILAVWCEAERGRATLADRVRASRSAARELRRPLAICTDEARFDLSVTGITEYHDQWWMPCLCPPGTDLDTLPATYLQEIEFCPLNQVVLIVGFEGEELPDNVRASHWKLCADLAQARQEVIGTVWLGAPATSAFHLLPQARKFLPKSPPPMIEVDSLTWGKATG